MIGFKKLSTDNVDLERGYSGYLAVNEIDFKDKREIIKKANILRRKIHSSRFFLDPSYMTDLEEYCCTLMSFIEAYPVDSSITFNWKGSTGSSAKSNCLLIELACNLYCIVVLTTQQIANMDISDYSNMDTLCENERKLGKAYSIIEYIIDNLSFVFNSENILPEFSIENLNGIKQLIHAGCQYIKCSKGQIEYKKDMKPEAFVSLYTGAYDLYESAFDWFSKATTHLPQDILEFAKAMSDYCYALTIYYEGYMTDKDLQDIAKHGRGKAFRCMSTYFEITNKLCQSTCKVVKSFIVPQIQSAHNDMKKKQQQICEYWRLTQSDIPANTEGFQLKSFVCQLKEPFPYKPLYDLQSSIGQVLYQYLQMLREEYQKTAQPHWDHFEKEMKRFRQNIDDCMKSLYVVAYEAMFLNESNLPKDINAMLLAVSENETKQPLKELESAYAVNMANYQKAINVAEDTYNDCIMKMNAFPQSFPQEVRRTVQRMGEYIQGKKKVFEEIKHSEAQPFFEKRDKFMNYIFPNGLSSLAKYIRDNNTILQEHEECLHNRLIRQHVKIELVKIGLDEDTNRMFQVWKSDRELRRDLMSKIPTGEIQKSFNKYLTLFQEESQQVLNKYKECNSFFAEMNKVIQEVKELVKLNKCFENKLKLYKVVCDRVDAYHQLISFYDNNNKDITHNIEGLGQSVMLMNRGVAHVKL